MTSDAAIPDGREGFIAWLAGELKNPRPPAWVVFDRLPALRWREGDEAPLAALAVECLRRHAIEGESPLPRHLFDRLEAETAAAFAWALFEQWQGSGAKPKDKWALYALGEWGDDDCVGRLARLVRDWPSKRKAQRALWGLDVFERLGSKAALAEIDAISTTAKTRALRLEAMRRFRALAKKRRLSPEALADDIVSDCGLMPDGSTEYSFGQRRFTAKLRPDWKLDLRDESGKSRATLPPPAKGDDQESARQSKERFQLQKRQIKEVAAHQAHRLEKAMIDGRSWNADRWRELFLAHPILRLLAQPLLWGIAAGEGTVSEAFRVAEDWTLADKSDDVFSLTGDKSVVVAHPLRAGQDLLASWKTIWLDYNLRPPFPQIDRECFSLAEEERGDSSIGRFAGLRVDGRVLLQSLLKSGWTSQSNNFGFVHAHCREFEAAGVVAIVDHEPVSFGFLEGAVVELGEIAFFGGTLEDFEMKSPQPHRRLELSALDPVVVSESVLCIAHLAGYAQ